MPAPTPTQESRGVVSFDVLIDGAKLAGALGPNLQSVEVEATYNRPDMCSVVFAAPEVSAEKTLPAVKPGAAMEIKVRREARVESVFKGEVTSIELDSRYGQTQYVLRAYDKRHRLYRGLDTAVYEQMKHSDIIKKLLSRRAVSAAVADSGSVMRYAVQTAMSDGDYLEQLLHEVGHVIVREADKFTVKPLGKFDKPVGVLEFGSNLESYTFRTSSDAWVAAVEVHDWDPVKKKAIVGTSSSPTVLIGGQKADYGQPFGPAKAHRAGNAFDDSSAKAMATAARDRMLAGSRQLEGTCDGNEKMVPGGTVKVQGIDSTYNGDYRLSWVRHRWEDGEGFTTAFACNEPAERSIVHTLGRAASGSPRPEELGERIWGVVPAEVTDNNDPEGLGRVKVKFPWLPSTGSGQVVSDWVRVAVPGAGTSQKGLYLMHEVGDEVLVAFEHGDPRRGYVLGGLYNSKDKPPLKNADCVKKGKSPQKAFRSSKGHQLTFNDSDDKPGIELITSDKNITLKLDETKGDITFTTKKGGSKVTISAHGDVTITSTTGAVIIESKTDIKIKAGTNMTLEAAANIDIKAGANATLDGGAVAAVKGKACAELTGEALATVSGKMVKIN